jgi:hypothetical protein
MEANQNLKPVFFIKDFKPEILVVDFICPYPPVSAFNTSF